MRACIHAGEGLLRVHLRGCAQDHRVNVVTRERILEPGRTVPGTVSFRDRGSLVSRPADDRDDFHPVYVLGAVEMRSEEHTSELQYPMRIAYADFCLQKQTNNTPNTCPS